MCICVRIYIHIDIHWMGTDWDVCGFSSPLSDRDYTNEVIYIATLIGINGSLNCFEELADAGFGYGTHELAHSYTILKCYHCRQRANLQQNKGKQGGKNVELSNKDVGSERSDILQERGANVPGTVGRARFGHRCRW